MLDAKPADQKARIYSSALLCQYVLKEHPSEALTAVRIGDSWAPNQTRAPNGQMFYQPFTIRALFIFRTDAPTPLPFKLTVTGVAPGGQRFTVIDTPTDIPGQARGRTFTIDLNLPADIPGVFWFDVYVNGEFSTRLPLEVQHPVPNQAPSAQK
jgi:hypothetical protein